MKNIKTITCALLLVPVFNLLGNKNTPFKLIKNFSIDMCKSVISPDGQYIIGKKNKEVKIYKIEEEKPRLIHKYKYSAPFTHTAFSPKGRYCIFENVKKNYHNYSLEIYDLSKNKIIYKYKKNEPIKKFFFSSDEKYFLYIKNNNQLELYNLDKTKKINNNYITNLAISPDKEYVISSDDGKATKIYQKIIYDYNHNHKIKEIKHSTDKSYCLSTEAKGDLILTYIKEEQSQIINMIKYSPNKKLIAFSELNKKIKICDLKMQKIVHEYSQKNLVQVLTFSPDSQYIASGGFDKKVKIYDLKLQKIVYEYDHDSIINSISFIPNENAIISMSENGVIKIVSVPFYEKPVPGDKENLCKRNNLCDLVIKTEYESKKEMENEEYYS